MELARILLGGGFTILVCFALGRVCLLRIPAPTVMALPVGAAALSLCVYALLSLGVGGAAAFVALGVVALLMAWIRSKEAAPLRSRFHAAAAPDAGCAIRDVAGAAPGAGGMLPHGTATVRERPSLVLIGIFAAYG